MTIREYRKGDFDGIMNLWVATGMGRPERGDDEQVIERSLSMGGCMLIMTDDEPGKIIGTSWITFDGRRLFLHHFGILPEYQGRGLAKELLKKSLAFVKQKGIQVKLEVHRNNIIARNLYINAGFEYLGDYDVYIMRELDKIRDL
ncbi:MAG TPA: GNAT family N-acetyltransferase [Bacteroidales bacterium]|nr:GNAT family N-acetyltransferase [Bacteroidales bacterium]HPT11428.1 GNAT family N-acetyltransferase [Bacteroidales bacterium]